MELNQAALKRLATTVRVLSIDAVEKAKSGHPGMPLGAADYAALLWAYYLRFDPNDPGWPNRDRFVLSAGHGSALLYALLHLFGCDLSLDDLRNFRQLGSKTPGHPEFGATAGVETTTGPLGQGVANGVGLAISAKMLAARYSARLFNYRVFGIVSDGDLMEGVASEAASLAGHLRLGNLIYLYDQNHITIAGSTDLSFTEDVGQRFEAYGWHVQSVDGHDFEALSACLDQAVAETERPSLICAHTVIGFGSPKLAGKADVHGAPLGPEEARATRENLGIAGDQTFCVPEEVRAFCRERAQVSAALHDGWKAIYNKWRSGDTVLGRAYEQQSRRELPPELQQELAAVFQEPVNEATRILSAKALQIIARRVPWLVGGSADLEPSTKTVVEKSAALRADDFSGRNIHFGVREHGMGSIANGLAYTRAWLPFVSTFLVFSDYMRPAIRLAALARLQVLFLFSHDSIWVGEDGPTHQPIEQIAALRLIPNLYVFRPADGIETAMCYWAALTLPENPSVLLFTRQKVPALKRNPEFKTADVLKGGYIVSGAECESLVLIASGSEVGLACAAAARLAAEGIGARVVSVPCIELFRQQPEEWRRRVLPAAARKVAIECGSTLSWRELAGASDLLIGIDSFGTSAPGEAVAEQFGFSPQAVCQKIRNWLAS